VIGGGKFANGAAQAGFGLLFNAWTSKESLEETGLRRSDIPKGHHPIAESTTRDIGFSREALRTMATTTTGEIPDRSEPKAPHRGSHPHIDAAQRKAMLNWLEEAAKRGITPDKMNQLQTRQMINHVTADPTVNAYLNSIRNWQDARGAARAASRVPGRH
jgi:hypothetical protein